jgi:hypothetical protein
VNDGVDRGHGARSAAWVLGRLVAERPAVSGLDLPFVAELCRWHEVPDVAIERLSLELVILKDADGLDRVRIGDLDPERLRLQHAGRLVEAAESLERRSDAYERITAEEVLATARHLLA